MTLPKIPIIAALLVYYCSACSSLTPEEETAMGEEQVQQINASMPLVEDAAVQAYIDNLVDQLLKGQGATDEIQLRIIASDGFNAFAVSGGNVYITAGTIKASHNVAELVSILAHELAHVIQGDHRHFYRTFNTTRALANVAGVALAIATGNPFIAGAGEIASDLGASTFISTHTRTQEQAADELAFNLMLNAGYDPRSQLTLFTRLEINAGNRQNVPVFLQTHPLPEERTNSTQARIAQLPPDQRLRINDGGALENIKRRL